jgi:hypothetical protein
MLGQAVPKRSFFGIQGALYELLAEGPEQGHPGGRLSDSEGLRNLPSGRVWSRCQAVEEI